MRFIKIKSSFLTVDNFFSMDIFLYDKERSTRLVALYQGCNVTEQMMLDWINFEKKGGYLQIIWEEMELFASEAKIDIEQVKKVNSFLFKMIAMEDERENKYSSIYNETFLLKTFLNENPKNDYMPLIKRVHDEIMLFPLSISKEVSLTTDLVTKVFNRDLLPVRIAALAYYLAKMNKIVDPEKLSSIVLASLIKDFGLNQLDRSLFKSTDHFSDELYYKHPMLSIFLMTKVGFEFSKLTKRLVLEHHEDTEGMGFPRFKKQDQIEPLSFYVNVADQIVMYSEGMISGDKVSIDKVLKTFGSQLSAENINTNLPSSIIDTIKSLIQLSDDT